MRCKPALFANKTIPLNGAFFFLSADWIREGTTNTKAAQQRR
jgi:hypothetical protein